MKAILLIIGLFTWVSAWSQQTSPIRIEQKGWLFLSDTNFVYNRIESGDVVLQPTFPDLFFPCKDGCKFSVSNLILFNMKKEAGIILPYFSNRDSLLSSAIEIPCYDSSGCYPFKKIFIIPVKINYILYSQKTIEICGKLSVSLNFKDLPVLLPLKNNGVSINRVEQIKIRL